MRAFVAITLLVAAALCCSALAGEAAHHSHSQPARLHARSSAIQYTPEALADQIHDLPGLDEQPSFNMFSGYLTIDAPTNRSVFYWYVESSGPAPESAPLLWWSNGGPDCSGLLGLLTEHGPFRAAAAPATGLTPSEFAWNKLANVLYVESPVGVGYSFSNKDDDYWTNDAETAANNLLAIQQFLQRFPGQANNDLYLSSQQYGGRYVPQLAEFLLQSGSVPSFRGFLIGNPLTDFNETMWGQAATLCGRSLASQRTCDAFVAMCPEGIIHNISCVLAQASVVNEAGALAAYGAQLAQQAQCEKSVEAQRLLWTLYHDVSLQPSFPPELAKEVAELKPVGHPDPCATAELTRYLNRADVRAALHVRPVVGAWEACSTKTHYTSDEVYEQMEPTYSALLAAAGSHPLRMLIFSNDDDVVTSTLGSQRWMNSGVLGEPISTWTPWHYTAAAHKQPQLGGYLTQWKGISLATVHGSGKLGAGYHLEQGLAVLDNFLSGAFNSNGKPQAAVARNTTHRGKRHGFQEPKLV